MPRKKVPMTTEYPIHISVRSENRTKFPIPLNDVWEIMSDYLFLINKGFGIQTHCFVLMPNHIHLLIMDPWGKRGEAMNHFLRESSKEINRYARRINHTYGARNFPCLVGDLRYYKTVYKYIYYNPVKAGLCRRVEDYPFSTLGEVLGRNKLVTPVIDDFLFTSDVESTLNWLNTSPNSSYWETVRRSLSRTQFKLARENGKLHPLENATL